MIAMIVTNVTSPCPMSTVTFYFSAMHGSASLTGALLPIIAAGPTKSAEHLVAWIQDFHLNESLGGANPNGIFIRP